MVACLIRCISIHAPVKGATIKMDGYVTIGVDFNPRTREGCDEVIRVLYEQVDRFQSTHP